MGMPKKIKAWQLFVDGKAYPSMVSGVKLPKLSRKFEEYQADIMNGPIEIDLGNEKMQAEFTYEEFLEDVLNQWGICNHVGVNFELRASEEGDDCQGEAVTVLMAGRYREIDMGDLEKAKSPKMKGGISLSRFAYYRSGRELVYIDHQMGIERSGGVDRTKKRRVAIGLEY